MANMMVMVVVVVVDTALLVDEDVEQPVQHHAVLPLPSGHCCQNKSTEQLRKLGRLLLLLPRPV
jgi:hypothetical protein